VVAVPVPVALGVEVEVPVPVAAGEVEVPVKVTVTVVVVTALLVTVSTFVAAEPPTPESVTTPIPLSSIQPASRAPQSPTMPIKHPVLIRILVAMVSSTRLDFAWRVPTRATGIPRG